MLKFVLLLLGLSAAVADLDAEDSFAVKLLGDQTLHSFTWTDMGTEPGDNASLRVCFSWNDTGSETAQPSLPFALTYSKNDNELFSVQSDVPDMLQDGIFCGNVLVDPETLSYSTEQTYIVNSEEVLAEANFTLTIQPGTLTTDYLTVANITRVVGLTDYDLLGCIGDSSSSCIVSDSSQPEELCTECSDSLSPSNSILVCDTTFKVDEISVKTAGTKTVLLYNDDNTVQVKTGAPDTSTVKVAITDPADGKYTPCVDLTCPASASPGTSVYTVVVVEMDSATYTSISSDKVIVQDLELTVVAMAPVIDFHMANTHSERMYEVFSSSTTWEEAFNGQAITLDCTGVPHEVPCYAFVSSDDVPQFVAVRYGDQTNAIVAKIDYPES